MSLDSPRSGGRPRRRLNAWELGGAATLLAVALFMVAEGVVYGIGTVRIMGAGFFPFATGFVLAALAAGIALEARHSDAPPPDIPLRPFACIAAALLLFALLIDRAGLVPATVALVLAGSAGDRTITPPRSILAAFGIAALGYVVFIMGLRLPLKPFWW